MVFTPIPRYYRLSVSIGTNSPRDTFSLSLHRHSYRSILFTLSLHNKQIRIYSKWVQRLREDSWRLLTRPWLKQMAPTFEVPVGLYRKTKTVTKGIVVLLYSVLKKEPSRKKSRREKDTQQDYKQSEKITRPNLPEDYINFSRIMNPYHPRMEKVSMEF